MTERKQIAMDEIEQKKESIAIISRKLWEYAELSLQEVCSAEAFCEIAEKENFHVEKGIDGIATAFLAKYGTGKPVIGILAEYDALSGLSQKAGALQKEEWKIGGNGHGCGHNLLGAGAFAAALGIKAYLEKTGQKGTVVLYGCPGEEGGASKAFMARDGIWNALDVALTWHPEDVNEVAVGGTNACIQVQYQFTGTASHASKAPEKGRSALDAVELMNIGVQFLREHMSDQARVHYAITNAGGCSPNVVQANASVLYMVRSNRVAEAVELQKRVDKIAEGAALMTETTVTRKFIDGTADVVDNAVLGKVAYNNFLEIGVPTYSQEELAFANALAQTYEGSDEIPGIAPKFDETLREMVVAQKEKCSGAMNTFLVPFYEGAAFNPESTDVGDVSWLTPTLQIHVTAWPNGCPGHSWQNVSCAGIELGEKAAICAGKVLAATAIDLFENTQIIAEARKEFEKKTSSGYLCPVPKDAELTIPNM